MLRDGVLRLAAEALELRADDVPRARVFEPPPDRPRDAVVRLLLAEAPCCLEFFDAMTRLSYEKASDTFCG